VSALFETADAGQASTLPLLGGPAGRVVAWTANGPVTLEKLLAHVEMVAAQLPPGGCAVNLCEDRYQFLVAFCAIVLAGHTNLLPPSRAPQSVLDVMKAHPDCYALADTVPSDAARAIEPPRVRCLPALDPDASSTGAIPRIDARQVVAIGYTSGSTGVPKANPKTWGALHASTTMNLALFGGVCGRLGLNVVATVPPQHMYGLEMSVLLPLIGDVAVHCAKPLFPADIARTLAELPAPRMLVATPVHLRALTRAGVAMPPLAAIVSATAPLSTELASDVEQQFAAPLIEVFGSTETCVIAHRRTAHDDAWRCYDAITLRPQPDGSFVDAPYFAAPVLLQDIVELLPAHGFRLCGRNVDLLEIAGKRASLGDLTRKLLAVPGVLDGIVVQLDAEAQGVRRIAALAVAPTLSPDDILQALRSQMDAVFLPRRLRCVASLPRNETGKLPRDQVLALLRG
jgi:acyl-coenzyme A synthetase/AMP-(fatty) acid ligase